MGLRSITVMGGCCLFINLPLLSFPSGRKAHRNCGRGATRTSVEKWIPVTQGVDYGIHENEPHRPSTVRRVMAKGPSSALCQPSPCLC